jgi:uncharacterized protein (TIGR02145 family)
VIFCFANSKVTIQTIIKPLSMKECTVLWLSVKSLMPIQIKRYPGRIKILQLSTLAFSLLLVGCSKEMQELSKPSEPSGNKLKSAVICETPLIAAQNYFAGTVTATFNVTGNQLTIAYSTINTDYCLKETHLDVQIDPANFPQTKTGNPKVGQFAYGATLGCKTGWTQVVDLTTVTGWIQNATVYIAAHANVKKSTRGNETAWANGLPFPGNNWAMYFLCYPPLNAVATATPPEINPGQSSLLNITATGGTGIYIYSWTSNPAGFTSSSQSPTVTPTFTTTYTCSVSSVNQEEVATAIVTVLPPQWQCGDIINDARNEKSYTTVQIGTQCWMAQNINIGTRIDGTGEQTNNSIIEKYCYNDLESNCDVYGGLYQWNEMMQYSTDSGGQGICPTGWHIPTDAEWTTLTTNVNNQNSYRCNSTFGYIAKAMAANSLWDTVSFTCAIGNNLSLNNATGFTAVPGGWRGNGVIVHLGIGGFWWSSSEVNSDDAWGRYMRCYSPTVMMFYMGDDKVYGLSVRCVKDN